MASTELVLKLANPIQKSTRVDAGRWENVKNHLLNAYRKPGKSNQVRYTLNERVLLAFPDSLSCIDSHRRVDRHVKESLALR